MSSLAFNTRVRHHGETERDYARALQQLALYAYKDALQSHIESRCREQFMAGLRTRDVKAHLSWFCSKTAKVHELVSRAEAFRATREEAPLMSDPEGSAVTVAYVQGNRPGKSFAQNQRSAPGVSAAKSQGDVKTAQQQGPQGGHHTRSQRRGKTISKYSPMDPNKCAGKCCFRCGKEGHFIADCRSVPTKCLYLAFDGPYNVMTPPMKLNVGVRADDIRIL